MKILLVVILKFEQFSSFLVKCSSFEVIRVGSVLNNTGNLELFFQFILGDYLLHRIIYDRGDYD